MCDHLYVHLAFCCSDTHMHGGVCEVKISYSQIGGNDQSTNILNHQTIEMKSHADFCVSYQDNYDCILLKFSFMHQTYQILSYTIVSQLNHHVSLNDNCFLGMN